MSSRVQDRLFLPARSCDPDRPARPVLNTDSPDALRDAIKRAYTKSVMEKISQRTRGASPAAPANRRN